MSGEGINPEFSDVLNDGYVAGAKAITDASEVELKIGGANLVGREVITVTNEGPNSVWYGPITKANPTDGDELKKGQFLSIPLGECLSIYMKCDTGQSATIKVQELG